MHALLSHKEVNLTEKILFNQEEAYFKNLLLPKSRHYINFILFLYLPGSNLLNLTLTITITHVTKPGQILIFLFQYKYGSNTVEVIDLRKTPSTRTGLFSEQPESGKYADFEPGFYWQAGAVKWRPPWLMWEPGSPRGWGHKPVLVAFWKAQEASKLPCHFKMP